MNPIRFGFHVGPGGNPTGIGDHIKALDAAGIPATVVSADVTTGLSDVFALWQKGSPVNHQCAFRVVKDGSEFYAVPNYGMPAKEAAAEYIGRILPHIPAEVKTWKTRVWIVLFNEVDKNRADWLGACAHEAARIMNAQGYKVLSFGWAPGTPEPEAWSQPGMLGYLTYCGQNPQMAGVALHEYSLHQSDLMTGGGWMVGRYRKLYEACDRAKLPYPHVMITEFGYTYDFAPSQEAHWGQMQRLYETYPDYPHSAMWYLGTGYAGIANRVQPYIAPATWRHQNWKIAGPLAPVGVWPTPPPPPTPGRNCGFARVGFKRKTYRINRKATWNQIQSIMGQILAEQSTFTMSNDEAAIGVGPDGKPLQRLIVEVGGEYNAAEIEKWYWDNYCIPPGDITHLPFPVPGTGFKGYTWPVRPLHPTNWATTDPWPGGWFDANPYLTYYTLPNKSKAYHTGADLNNNRPRWDADRGAELYAIAEGVITFAGFLNVWGNVMVLKVDDPNRQHVYVRYGHVDQMLVKVNDRVQRGQLIATVGQDAVGGPFHLHFDISLTDVLLTKPWHWPKENRDEVLLHYVEPAQFLLDAGAEYINPPAPLPTHTVPFGIHASADSYNMTNDVRLTQTIRPGLVKFLSSHRPEDVRTLANVNNKGVFVIRAFLSMSGRVITPEQFYNDTIGDVRRTVEALRAVGVKNEQIWLEIGANEANLTSEGLGTSWRNASEYAIWFAKVLDRYLIAFGNDQGIKFLFAGLSPGEAITGLRQHYHDYLKACSAQINRCDGLGVHTYWSPPYPIMGHPHSGVGPVDDAVGRFGELPIMITECSHNGGGVPAQTKAESILQFWTEMKKRRQVKGLAIFVLSSSNTQWGHQPGGSGEIITDQMATVFSRR